MKYFVKCGDVTHLFGANELYKATEFAISSRVHVYQKVNGKNKIIYKYCEAPQKKSK